MFFRWWKRRRRRRVLGRSFPAQWLETLETNVRMYSRLTDADKAAVANYVQIFVAEKNWEGCGGLIMTDEVRVTIAAQVAILVLGLADEYFDKVLSILVYPDAYVSPERTETASGLVLEKEVALEGEAWYRGPIVLSWADVLAGAREGSSRSNLVLHEFAHQLDMLNGNSADGVPPMETTEMYQRWNRVMTQNFQQLIRDCESGRSSFLDCYAATHMSEFFAVVTETFFQSPVGLRNRHPDLYDAFRDYYRQDPAERINNMDSDGS